MTHVIVGSAAVQNLVQNYRTPADLDVWYYGDIDAKALNQELRIELKEMPKKIVDYVWEYSDKLDTHYTIKLAHAAWDVKWSKTVNDLMFFKKNGAKCDDFLYNMLFAYWEEFHGSKEKLSLKKTKDEFFKNAVVRPLDHDYMHELMAHYDKPLYQTVLKDGEQVLIDKDKYMALSEKDRLLMIREETYVIALERFYIPLQGKIPAVVAYRRALKLVATRLTKGWFCKYLLDNYSELCHTDKTHNFVKIFNERNKDNDIESENYRRLQRTSTKALKRSV